MYKVSWIRQLILAITLVVLGYGAFYFEYKHKPAQEEHEEQAKHVFQLKDVPVKSIQLVRPEQTIELKCLDFNSKLCKATDHSKWEMAVPKKLKADDSNVNNLLATLNQLTPSDTIQLKNETPEKKAALLKEYALDPQSQKKAENIQVTTEKGTTTLYIGQTHPVGDTLFALKQGDAQGGVEDQVYLIPTVFKANLEHDLTYWRNKKLSTLASHEIDQFKLQGSKETFLGERKNGQWTLKTNQEEVLGESELIDQLIANVTQLSAKSFVSDSKSDAQAKSILKGLTNIITLTVTKEKENKEKPEPIVFSFFQKPGQKRGSSNEKLYATVSNLDPLFEIDSSVRERIDKTLKDLRQTKLLSMMDRYSARNIEFSGQPIGPSPLNLNQVNGKWINTADGSEIPQDKIQNLLDRLSANPIRDFLSQKAIPSGEQQGVIIKLGDEKEKAKRELVFWKKDQKLYGRDLKSDRKEAYLLDSSIQEVLPWDKDFYKKKETQNNSLVPHNQQDSKK